MRVFVYHHPSAQLHDNGPGHPEAPRRIDAILSALESDPDKALFQRMEPPEARLEQLSRVHEPAYVERILSNVPKSGLVRIDADTSMSPASGEASKRAAGGACDAVDKVMSGEIQRAFIAMRPPGHHAEPDRAMGFCLFNSIAIAAEHARATHAIDKIAIVDFDVHHGNGTQAAFWSDPQTLFVSTHQWPLYPGTGAADETGDHDNILNLPMPPGVGSAHFRQLFERQALPRVASFEPELLLISAGFDAHRLDPLAQIDLNEADFGWATKRLAELSEKYCDGRIVSVLEGGYHPAALAGSVMAHLKAMAGKAV